MTPPSQRKPWAELQKSVSLVRPRCASRADPLDLDTAPPLALIIDDDDVFRTVARAYLEDSGFRVAEAASGPKAVEVFELLTPDIVLLDILMPGMDGFDTCNALRELPGGRQTPIVMMTGVEDRESIERAYDMGATDFVVKPINAFILKHRLQHILRANRYLVHFDALTALPRRDLFLERLEIAIAHGRRFESCVAVLFLDLDDFQRFNDTLGHVAGDQILRQVGSRLGELRAGDYFARNGEHEPEPVTIAQDRPVARFGGDEFMLLLPDIRFEKDIAVVARRVNESLSRPFRVGGKEIHVTASIGISAYPLDGSNPQLLLERAAVAMNHAKRAGKGRYQFYEERLNAKIQARLSVEGELRRALETNRLEVHYQPKVDIQNGQVTGMEALVRMPAVNGKPVSPSDFIPIAEDTGLIVPLGDWVFRNACTHFTQLPHRGSGLTISVNLSTGQFRQPELPRRMLRVLEELNLDPSCVELELTESVLLEDTHTSFTTLADLKQLGFRIAVDDFGTGYSSLAYLKRFPLDVLKIDRSFVSDLPNDPSDAAIVEAIIHLGQKLELEIVAEGVDRPRQLEFLRERGCDQIQGYLFSRPLSFDALCEWLTRWEAEPDPALVDPSGVSLSEEPPR